MTANETSLANGRVLKAATVRLRGTDVHSIPVETRIAEAADEAFHLGYTEGYAAGAAQAGADLIEVADRLRRSVLVALGHHAEQVRANRASDAEQLTELALAVAEWAVRRELASVPDAFFARLAEVLADRDRHDHVEITTSPGLVDATRQWLADDEIRVVGADDLEDGEARVALGDTTVFATFTDAFERARSVLDHLEPHHEADHVRSTPADHADHADHAGQSDDADEDEDDEIVEVIYDANLDGAW